MDNDLERLKQLLEETRHVVQYSGWDWTVAHPIRERLDLESLFACTVRPKIDHNYHGRFWLNDNGTIGEPL